MLHTMRRPKALRRADTDPWTLSAILVASRILFANPEYCNREEVAAGLRNKIPADRQNNEHTTARAGPRLASTGGSTRCLSIYDLIERARPPHIHPCGKIAKGDYPQRADGRDENKEECRWRQVALQDRENGYIGRAA
jgi:hypothetical protein